MPLDTLLLLGRVLIAALFLPAAYQTLSDVAGATGYFDGLGLPYPAAAAWGVGLFELVGGALVLVGWHTRAAALALAAFCVAAAIVGHHGQGGDDPTLRFMHMQMFWKDIAIAGGLLALAAAEAGAWSVDGRQKR